MAKSSWLQNRKQYKASWTTFTQKTKIEIQNEHIARNPSILSFHFEAWPRYAPVTKLDYETPCSQYPQVDSQKPWNHINRRGTQTIRLRFPNGTSVTNASTEAEATEIIWRQSSWWFKDCPPVRYRDILVFKRINQGTSKNKQINHRGVHLCNQVSELSKKSKKVICCLVTGWTNDYITG